ncbi:hypothetical protein MACK_002342 [Theileria orientalis]|uniref:Uncharacterized protein n=1 Tax=Theileria orientalis TaxID=68886 RepID=A0A976ME36_THEOR|nr:hypothetical protein MACK_002342 [Theileria orientalis]
MDDINSSAEVALLSSMEIMEDSVDMSVVKNELKRIKDFKNRDNRDVLNVLEDCITDSAVSINELNEYSNNSSRTSIKKNNNDTNRLVKDIVGNNVNSDTVSGKSGVVKADDSKTLTIKVNEDLNISFDDSKLNIIIRSQSYSRDITLKVALFLMLLLILVR